MTTNYPTPPTHITETWQAEGYEDAYAVVARGEVAGWTPSLTTAVLIAKFTREERDTDDIQIIDLIEDRIVSDYRSE